MTTLVGLDKHTIKGVNVEVMKIYDKHLGTYYNVYINGELKPTRYSWLKRYTKPSKSEIKKYIEKNLVI